MVAEEFKSGTGSVCDELVSVVIDDGGDVDAEGAEGAMSVCPSRSTLSNDFLHWRGFNREIFDHTLFDKIDNGDTLNRIYRKLC